MKKEVISNLTSSKLLTKNVIINFLAQGIPLLIALVTIPFIIRGLGVDRFSILTLIWIVIGYSNLFDFGLGRALTQSISKKLAIGDTNDIPALIWTALIVVFVLGIFGTVVIFLLSPIIIHTLLKIPEPYLNETFNSLYLLALTMPLLLIIVNIKGILEAYQEFLKLSILRIPVVLFNYIGPLFILPFTNNLFHIVILLVVGRFITFILYIIACRKVVEGLTFSICFDKKFLKPLISFGGWITVSNVFGPITNYMDRFFIAFILSALIVAYYTTPFDVITRLLIIPQALIVVMFPAFSAEFSLNKNRTRKMYKNTMIITGLIMTIPVILIVLFAKFGLALWLDANFAEKSFRVAQIIAVGVLVESLNQVPIALIQGTGRSDITGKIILLVLPVYFVLLLYLIKLFGLPGVAYAWLIRSLIDFVLLNIFAIKLFKVDNPLYKIAEVSTNRENNA